MKKLRLTTQESETIMECILSLDRNAIVFLYGSRLDEHSRGGDLDLFVLSEILSFTDKLDILSLLKERLGDQKIDLTILNQVEFKNSNFFQSILMVRLTR